MTDKLHPTHVTRISMDASSYDEVCVNCGATDSIGSWGRLTHPCPKHAKRSVPEQPIITQDRITALCNINRWRGWTHRPYSVGEHTAVGAWVLSWFKRPDEQVKRWWMHDMHETEIVGDVPTPDKKLYMSVTYDVAVEKFDARLGAEMGLDDLWWRDKGVKQFDHKMLIVENDLIALRKDPKLPAPDYSDPMNEMIRDVIVNGTFTCTKRVIVEYRRDASRFGWEDVCDDRS